MSKLCFVRLWYLIKSVLTGLLLLCLSLCFFSFLYLWRDTPSSVSAEYLITQTNNSATHLGVKQQALGPAMHTETCSQTNVTLLYSSIWPHMRFPGLCMSFVLFSVLLSARWPLVLCVNEWWSYLALGEKKKNIPGIWPFCSGSLCGNLRQ